SVSGANTSACAAARGWAPDSYSTNWDWGVRSIQMRSSSLGRRPLVLLYMMTGHLTASTPTDASMSPIDSMKPTAVESGTLPMYLAHHSFASGLISLPMRASIVRRTQCSTPLVSNSSVGGPCLTIVAPTAGEANIERDLTRS